MSSNTNSENLFSKALSGSILSNIGVNPYQELASDSGEEFEGTLLVQESPDEEVVIEHYFVLAKNHLICYGDASKTNTLFKINFNDIWKFYYDYEVFSTSSSADAEDEDPTYFLFLRSKKELHLLYCPTLFEYFQWIQKLRSKCILSNFGNIYKQKESPNLGGSYYLFANAINQQEYLVKIFSLEKLQKPENYELLVKLRNQITIMKSIYHSNIINLFEVYEGKTNLYLVYDKISGISLNQLQIESLKVQEFEAIMNQKGALISAIEYLHSKGIAHQHVQSSCIFFKNANLNSELILCNFQQIDTNSTQKIKTYKNASEFAKIEQIFQQIQIKYQNQSNVRQ